MQFISKFHDHKIQVQSGTTQWMRGAGGENVPVQVTPLLVADFQRGQLRITDGYGDVNAETAAFVWRELARQFFDGKDTSLNAHEPHGAYRHDGVTTATDGEGDNVFFAGSRREEFYGIFDTEDTDLCEPQWREVYEAVLTADAGACARLSKEHGFLGASALRPVTDLRAGEMVILDKLLAGEYGEFIVQTPDGPFVTGLGLTSVIHRPRTATSAPSVEIAGAVPVEVAAAQQGWPANFPWPGYDDLGGNAMARAKVIEQTVVLINLDPGRVLAYELEHKAQKPTITRLTKLVNSAGPAPVAAAAEPDEDEADAELASRMAVTVS